MSRWTFWSVIAGLALAGGLIAAQTVVPTDVVYYKQSPNYCLSFDDAGAGGKVEPYADVDCNDTFDGTDFYFSAPPGLPHPSCSNAFADNEWQAMTGDGEDATCVNMYDSTPDGPGCTQGSFVTMPTDDAIGRFKCPPFVLWNGGSGIRVLDSELDNEVTLKCDVPQSGGATAECSLEMLGSPADDFHIENLKGPIHIESCAAPNVCGASDSVRFLSIAHFLGGDGPPTDFAVEVGESGTPLDLRVHGEISELGGNLTLGDGTDKDLVIKYDLVTDETFYWRETEDYFEFSEDVDIIGGLTCNGGGECFGDDYVSRSLVNGTFQESFDALVTSDGATVTMSLEKSGGGDLTMQFSDGNATLDTTPADTIALTAGTDTTPQENFIYVLQSTGVLTKDTSGWPATEHIKVGYFLVPSATFTQASGVYINQNWNDHLKGTDEMGHLAHMAERSRRLGAVYFSGVAGNGTDGYLTPTAGNVELKSTAGVIYQMHKHTVPAFDTSGTDEVLVVNWSGDAYHNITNLYDITADSTGTAITNNKWFNLVVWGVGNKGGEYTPMMINLPGGSYNTQSGAEADLDGYDNFSIPTAYKTESSTGFLIARITIQMKTGGGTWVVGSTADLRGTTPSTASGSVGAAVTPGGSDTEIQFNDSGEFGGDSDHTWNKTTNFETTNGTQRITDGLGNNWDMSIISSEARSNVPYPGVFQVNGVDYLELNDSSVAVIMYKGFNAVDGGVISPGMTFSPSTATASTTQSQGQGTLTRCVTEVDVVANDDDVVTLLDFSTCGFTIVTNTDSAEILQVYPNTGDDLGEGANSSTQVPPGWTLECWAMNSNESTCTQWKKSATDIAYWSGYDTTGGTTITSAATVTIDTVFQSSSASVFSLASNQLTVSKTGIYEVTMDCTTGVTSGTTRSESQCYVEVNTGVSFAEITGTRCENYNRTATVGDATTCSATFLHSITSGDILRIRAVRTAGTSTVATVADQSRLTVREVR